MVQPPFHLFSRKDKEIERQHKSAIITLSTHRVKNSFVSYTVYIRNVNSLIKNCIYAIYFVNGGTNGPSADKYSIVLICEVIPTLISTQVNYIYLCFGMLLRIWSTGLGNQYFVIEKCFATYCHHLVIVISNEST